MNMAGKAQQFVVLCSEVSDDGCTPGYQLPMTVQTEVTEITSPNYDT